MDQVIKLKERQISRLENEVKKGITTRTKT